jgi:hypothetical protein
MFLTIKSKLKIKKMKKEFKNPIHRAKSAYFTQSDPTHRATSLNLRNHRGQMQRIFRLQGGNLKKK